MSLEERMDDLEARVAKLEPKKWPICVMCDDEIEFGSVVPGKKYNLEQICVKHKSIKGTIL